VGNNNPQTEMNLSDFDFELPPEAVAAEPADKRDDSRLLVVDRNSDQLQDRKFADILDFLKPGDVLVYNNSRVIPARLFGTWSSGGRVEVLLHKALRGTFFQNPDGSVNQSWSALLSSSRKPKPGDLITFDEEMTGRLENPVDRGEWMIRFTCKTDFRTKLMELGRTPLPPYIVSRRKTIGMPEETDYDSERYQTVYASKEGSVAAPTAGLHFTDELIAQAESRGVITTEVTLHVGLGTFLPLRNDDVEENRLHSEFYNVTAEAIETINQARTAGRRIIAVGTTTVRVLEYLGQRRMQAGGGELDLYIYPGYEFKVINGLITNFHLPKSSLLLLVAAFAGREKMLTAYRHAVESGYRFYSYGDATLII
jgi:S-adenosylmethionine:tRNA ribosyltransferase-isomerase